VNTRSRILLFAFVLSTSVANSQTPVASFDFDSAGGGPDAQGWRPLAMFSSEETHFHVEDFSGAGHEAAALQGQRSMWCGATAEDQATCHWSGAPGYGSSWHENFVSQPFVVTGDVNLSFLMQNATEDTYDFVFLEYEDNAGEWVGLDSYDCGFWAPCLPSLQSYVVPASAHDGSLRFRFNFDSDPGVDNENPLFFIVPHIAFVLDSLTVSDALGDRKSVV